MSALAPATIDVLRHLSVHGRQNAGQIKAAVPNIGISTIGNLNHLGHIASLPLEQGGCEYSITGKGLRKLNNPNAPAREPTKTSRKAQAKADRASNQATRVMESATQTEKSILATLRRAMEPISIADICRRMNRPERIVRPSLTALVQADTVRNIHGNPIRYHLPREQSSQPRTFHSFGSQDTYNGAELMLNPSIPAERMKPYDLPRREGSRLYWPDGRVTGLDANTGEVA